MPKNRNKYKSRKASNFKYIMIKSMLRRAKTFKSEAKSNEEIEAWDKVEGWLRSFIGIRFRFRTKRGAIGIDTNHPDYDLDKLMEQSEQKSGN